MFNSPFADDKSSTFGCQTCPPQPQFNTQPQQGFVQQQQMPQQGQPVNQPTNDMNILVQSLRPQTMSNPVMIVEPSYVVTERQLQQMIALAQGNPNIQVQSQPQGFSQGLPQGQPQQQVLAPNQYQPQQVVQQSSESKSWFDELGNITFGTVGRIGHTLTTVADGVIDILTLGYATKK